MIQNVLTNPDSFLKPEEQKRARELLKTGALVFCSMDKDGKLRSILKDGSKSFISVELTRKDSELISKCTCGNHEGICIHCAATILHYVKHSHIPPKSREVERKPVFSGLIQKEIGDFLETSTDEFKARVFLELESAMPHSPSRWANCVFEVNIMFEKREYKGSLGNLRQIHFKDVLGGSMRISHFPPQDRQIIRFLAINAEADGFKLSLSSETAAEFFHSLSGFDNFRCGKEKITVHRNPVLPVLSTIPSGDGYFLRPGIETEKGHIPLKDPRIIMGKSGCWIGLSGDYWWIPATMDLVWLRNFLHAKEQLCDSEKARQIISNFSRHSVKTAGIHGQDLRYRDFIPVYHAKFAKDKSLQLKLCFDYAGSIVYPADKRLAESSGKYWKRNLEKEREYENEVLLIGFRKKNGGEGLYTISDTEAYGLFFEKIMSRWIDEKREIYISPECSSFFKKGDLEEFVFRFRNVVEENGFFKIKYQISTFRGEISWKQLTDAVRNGRTFIETSNNNFGRISDRLGKFVKTVSDFVQIDPEDDGIIIISRASALFWIDTAKELLGDTPSEFLALKNRLEKTSDDESGLSDFHGILRTYQNDGFKWIRKMAENGLNTILADEMGLGKTIQALVVIACYRRKTDCRSLPALILCPSSLVENWEMEAEKFVPSLKTLVLKGPDRAEHVDKINGSDIVISSYALAKRDIETYGKFNFSYLILDEAQHIKNPGTANAKACKSITAEHRLVLTGTPLENSAEELWSIFDFLHPGMLGSYRSFRFRYAGIRDSVDKQLELASRVAPFILRRKKKDVAAELPEKIEQVIYCEMEDEQRKFYSELLEKGRDECSNFLNGKITKFDILTSLLRLRQFCCHPTLLPENFGVKTAKSAKTELMQELLLESIDSGHRLLVFSQFVSLLKIVRSWLDEQSIKYEYLDGSTENRMERVINFNSSPDIPVFLLSLKAGGSGLNLTSADRVIIYDPWWNPAVEMQATDRTHRIGQEKSVCSMKLVIKDSIEEKMLVLQRKKQTLFTNLVDSVPSTLGHLSNEDIQFLLSR
ncbi:MAG: DEAD/DEAH box helicase [Victivallales bacterium]